MLTAIKATPGARGVDTAAKLTIPTIQPNLQRPK